MNEDKLIRNTAVEILKEYLHDDAEIAENKIYSYYGHDSNQYCGRIIKVVENMKSDYVKECISNGIIKKEEIYNTDRDFLCPEKWQKLQDLRMPKSIIKERKLGLYKCKKCGSRETNFSQFQSRSADEGMTTRIECLSCLCVTKF